MRTAAISLATVLAVGTGLLAASPVGSVPSTLPGVELTASAAGAVNGVAFDTQPVVTFYDAQGAVDTARTCPVEVTASPGTLSGTTTVNAVAGVATFAGVALTGTSGTVTTLTFTVDPLTTDALSCGAFSTPLTQTITPTDAASDIAITTGLGGGSAVSNRPIATQPVVRQTDGTNTVTAGTQHPVTVTIAPATGNTTTVTPVLGGTTTKTTVAGVATFTELTITAAAGSYDLTYTLDLGLGNSNPTVVETITVALPVATQAIVTTQASGGLGTGGGTFSTQPVIRRADANGVTVTEDPQCLVTASVTAGGGSVSGTTTAATVNGVATFTGLAISGNPSTTQTITYTMGSGTGNVTGCSTPFAVTQTVAIPGPTATRLVLSRSAANAMNGHAVHVQPQVTVTDANGITVTGSTFTITASVAGGATLSGTTTATTVNGIATFSGLIVNGTPGTSYTLTYSSSGLTSASQQITVSVATRLGVQRAPSGVTSGSPFTVQPVIARQNASGTTIIENPPSVVTATVSGGATLVGATTATTVNGLATFTNLGVTGANGAAYSITFTAPGMTSTSTTVVVGTAAAVATTATPVAQTTATSAMADTGAKPTKTAAQRTRQLGGGVALIANPTVTPKVLRTPIAQRLDRTVARPVTKKAVVRLTVADLPKGAQVALALRIGGKWVGVERTKVDAKRAITVSALRFTKAGTFPLRLRFTGGTHTQYARIVVK